LIGRIAGGELAAFAGSKRLKTAPGIYRQRISGDYRLLFRLHSDRLEILDLIHRRDLERKIKTLT
jgi:mRNA-degrading endonuclease RelE of RelBE toxin-antitoxin system